ncbi:hypothetical protein MNEG_3456 [Monoraphidium neglectum]|uniref:Sugar phosphate transporter domain-containing protein n=1 Tax=Monoraphidium neglectum TaxID=145388 RepID=A0A0D2NHN7_9CHLO|nr:hypothetical protein MNEG_3456 [Monoraphidium neglectum]KIZ04506.1 hypothetical protein MNEG_3456 [Monoraphidium neglectum]|eukprot:XP_013903525.1 hypothetical protein MNEG_3456 [Monoraphidium neglectum]
MSSANTRKRSLLDVLADDEPTLWIQVADGTTADGASSDRAGDSAAPAPAPPQQPPPRIPAHRELLRFDSTCVRNLPPGDTWDISGLVIDGQRVTRPVVVAWLEAVYAGSTYWGDTGVPPAEEGEIDGVLLLRFADAVGSSIRVVRECYERCREQLASLEVRVRGEPARLKLDGSFYTLQSNFDSLTLVEGTFVTETEVAELPLGDGAANAAADDFDLEIEATAELQQNLAAQLERLLHIAYSLGLRELQSRLHHFIHANVQMQSDEGEAPEGLLPVRLLRDSVFSKRVMAAVDSGQLKDAWLQGILSVPCDLSRADGLFGEATSATIIVAGASRAADGGGGNQGGAQDADGGGYVIDDHGVVQPVRLVTTVEGVLQRDYHGTRGGQQEEGLKLSFGLALMFVGWYGANIYFNIAQKQVLKQFAFPLACTNIQFAIGSCLALLFWATGVVRAPRVDAQTLKSIVPLAVIHVLGNVLTNVSLGKVAVSFTHTVKAMEPFFSVIMSAIFLGTVPPPPVLLTLVPIVGGVVIASVTEATFNWTGFLSAMFSNITFQSRSATCQQV